MAKSSNAQLEQFNTRISRSMKTKLEKSLPAGFTLQQLLKVMSEFWLSTPKDVRDHLLTAESSGATPWSQDDSPFETVIRRVITKIEKEKKKK